MHWSTYNKEPLPHHLLCLDCWLPHPFSPILPVFDPAEDGATPSRGLAYDIGLGMANVAKGGHLTNFFQKHLFLKKLNKLS